jgi:hypothetical protein
MSIRKIAVVGSFAAGAALALAPLASADDLTPTVDSEIGSINAIFLDETSLAGLNSSIIVTHGPNTFDTIPLQYAPDTGTPTLLDYELYGVNPIANAASDPGAYNVFNGALVEFDDAYNTGLYAVLNGGALIPEADLFGSQQVIDTALATGSATGALITLYSAGFSDLLGYLGL